LSGALIATAIRSKPPRVAASEFINRELSLLAFHRRVFAQAEDPSIPLLERFRFLCITASNLDEFFEVRVAGLKKQVDLGAKAPGPDRHLRQSPHPHRRHPPGAVGGFGPRSQ